MTRLAVIVALLTSCTATYDVPAQSEAPGMKRWTAGASGHAPVKARPRHRARAASRRLSRRPIVHNWAGVAACESSGNWQANTGNGYYGGLQENQGFWVNYGGLAFATRPDLASRAQQIVVAERGLAVQGAGAWPVCGAAL